MKHFFISLTFSLIIHMIIFAMIYSLGRDKLPLHRRFTIELTPEQPVRTIQPAPIIQRKPKIKTQAPTGIITDESAPIESSESVRSPSEQDIIANFDSLYEIIRLKLGPSSIFHQKAWKAFVLKKVKEQYFLSFESEPSQGDSHALVFSPGEFKDVIPLGDDIAGLINKRNQGINPTVSPMELMSKLAQNRSKEEIPTQFDFIPSASQISAMAYLYKNEKATQLDIYRNLETTRPLTAERLNQNLDFLFNKGFLFREKISPENIFSLFGIPIEMSAKNRKNPIYLYESKVDKNKIIDFLQSRLYLLQEKFRSAPADSSILKPQIQEIQRNIQLLLL